MSQATRRAMRLAMLLELCSLSVSLTLTAPSAVQCRLPARATLTMMSTQSAKAVTSLNAENFEEMMNNLPARGASVRSADPSCTLTWAWTRHAAWHTGTCTHTTRLNGAHDPHRAWVS
eukprot:3429858-Prymnesium_polylepis.1